MGGNCWILSPKYGEKPGRQNCLWTRPSLNTLIIQGLVKDYKANNCTARRETSSVCSGSLYCASGIINRAKTTAVILHAVLGDYPPTHTHTQSFILNASRDFFTVNLRHFWLVSYIFLTHKSPIPWSSLWSEVIKFQGHLCHLTGKQLTYCYSYCHQQLFSICISQSYTDSPFLEATCHQNLNRHLAHYPRDKWTHCYLKFA